MTKSKRMTCTLKPGEFKEKVKGATIEDTRLEIDSSDFGRGVLLIQKTIFLNGDIRFTSRIYPETYASGTWEAVSGYFMSGHDAAAFSREDYNVILTIDLKRQRKEKQDG